MIYMGMLTGNAVIDAALLAWFLAQVIKVVIELLLARRFDARLFVSSGGMPSSHSSLIVACATSIGRLYGTSEPVFALAVVVAAVVMYDACNVRRSAGDTAKLVNKLLEHVEKLTAEELADSVKEIMGHTPIQVLMGSILGFCVGMLA